MADSTKRLRNMSTALTSFVQAQIGDTIPCPGDVFFLVPAASSTAQYKTWLEANGVPSSHYSTSLTTIEDRMVAGRNDVLIIMPGAHAVTATFTWDKDYTHIIGACSPVMMCHRSRIYTTGAAVSPLITFSADNCVVKNIMFDHQGTHASTAARVMTLTGDRNYFEKVHLRHIGALSVPGTSMRLLYTTSSNGENLWHKCTIGYDSVDGNTGDPACIEYAGTNTARDVYDQCILIGNGAASGLFVKAGTTATTSFIMFRDCDFFNNVLGSLDAMTQGFSIASGNGYFLLSGKTRVFGATALETSDSGLLQGENAIAAATSNSYVALTL